uniref:Uncharacterized protein n=1 Tax=Cacopsylla melanoneura TaxID=428564 RepID=A0A8D8ZQ33_9HEMI
MYRWTIWLCQKMGVSRLWILSIQLLLIDILPPQIYQSLGSHLTTPIISLVINVLLTLPRMCVLIGSVITTSMLYVRKSSATTPRSGHALCSIPLLPPFKARPLSFPLS